FPAFTTSRTELSARLEKAAPMDIKAVYERIFRIITISAINCLSLIQIPSSVFCPISAAAV
ncbi:hypothetical protein, partial [Cloacibacillus evryensis]|uniref:hypothetical protein n=1 Tax=Cloacibacillus evryensis TaxID=508460 RepID=UPI00210ED8C6